MAAPKGHIGYPVVGDKSIEFYKDPIEFVNRRINDYSERIFQSRVINTPTVFIASCQGVHQLLHEKSQCFDMGYRVFMYSLYGDNLLFTGHEEAHRIRKVLQNLFCGEAVKNWDGLIGKLINRNFDHLCSSTALPMYKVFKQFATELSLSIFLGLDVEESTELTHQIIQLTTTHWHGIISVPFSMKVPYWSSGYKKAVGAKKALFDIIYKKLSASKDGEFLHQIRTAGFKDTAEAAHHALLFISALVPKAIASLLTSFTILMAQPENEHHKQKASESQRYLHQVLLEVQRLWPPFLGGRRLATQDCIIDGIKIPKDYAAVYITYAAHRDPKVFPEPEVFHPDRWQTYNAGQENLLSCYGGGPRDCVGKVLMEKMIQTVCQYLLDHYTWKLPDDQDLTHKWLPVSRPKEQVMVTYYPVLKEEQSSSQPQENNP
ncbi:uncharacterized protein LOC144446581 isoform X2 [Glandiceps talaboti]